jgi:processive 1,2-diacylglycerol beta-glucosyltransferase
MSDKKNLAIFSVSAGAGHIRAGEALRACCEKEFPLVNAVHLDLMTIVPALFKKMYADSYIKIVENHPTLWSYLYRHADREKADSALNRLRRGIERLNTRGIDRVLSDLAPDVVICTHFLPAELLSRLIRNGEFSKPVYVQVTDFDIHAMWIHQHMAGYFAASDEVRWRMGDRGLDRNHIEVTGIPIMPVFSEKLSRPLCAAELGLDPQKTTLLMMSGGAGLGGIEQLVDRLLTLEGDFQIIALAGRNEELLEHLKSKAAKFPKKLFPQGFTTTIERLMAVADLAITKPGGLTTSECLAVGLPMILVSPIPGQEERNADYLLENGTALKAYDAAGLEFRVQALLADRERLARMRTNALSIARPFAARDVLKKTLGPVLES